MGVLRDMFERVYIRDEIRGWHDKHMKWDALTEDWQRREFMTEDVNKMTHMEFLDLLDLAMEEDPNRE